MSRTTTTGSEELVDPNALTEDDLHSLLADDRRRHVLRILADRSEPVGLDDLARELADWEGNLDRNDQAYVSRVETILHHKHLPMMDDLGVLDYDPASNRVQQ